MTTTYFQATSIGRDVNPKTGRVEIRGVRVSVMRPHDDDGETLWLEDETVETGTFGRDQIGDAARWLADRGCSLGEASRVILVAMAEIMAQTTGIEPTTTEKLLEAR